jgi:hypothetical protein
MNPLFHLQEDAAIAKPGPSLLLRTDVEVLYNFHDYMKNEAKKSHVSSIPAIRDLHKMRGTIADTLKEALRTQKGKVEISVQWDCYPRRDLAVDACRKYIKLFDDLKKDPRAMHWLSVDVYSDNAKPCFERIIETIAQTRN